MRLLLFNQATDSADPIHGFATRWIGALARRVDHVDVVTMRAGRVEVPANVRVMSVGKERGWSEPRRAVQFYRHLRATDGADACFSHMIPLFSVLAAPVIRRRGIPLVTWYAHRHVSPLLRLAHRLSDRVVTSAETSYGYRRDKLTVIGQGIDTALFAPGEASPESPPLVLSVGRLSPVKGLETLVDAIGRIHARGLPVRCALVGAPPAHDRAYADRLRQRVAVQGLTDVVTFVGPVPYGALPQWYARATVHVNLSPTGALDKSALEAMACGRPSVVANSGFADTLGPSTAALHVPHGDPEALAARLCGLLSTSAAERTAMGAALRRRVCTRHDLDGLASRLVGLLADLGTPA